MYDDYYEKHGPGRNDLLANPEVTFQAFAFDRANIRALRQLKLDRATAKILDVGCGSGTSLLQFLRLGFPAANLTGVDADQSRIAEARERFPNVRFECETAESLSFPDAAFDLVFESTLFMMLTSDAVARAVATEMLRVTRPGAYVMLVDWRYAEPGSREHRAVSGKRIDSLFRVGTAADVVARERGALIPPLGRILSRVAPPLYFVVQTLFPFAVGQITTVLRKR